jgi:5-methylcytosine-specific restriction enzyme A
MAKAMRICATPGCPEVTEAPYCPVCEAKRPKRVDTRALPSARGYDHRWHRYSASYRSTHPLCRPCQLEGRRSRTQAVDHIRPVTGPNDPGFWDPTNHQPICRSCHAVKTQAEGRTQRAEPGTVPARRSGWTFA